MTQTKKPEPIPAKIIKQMEREAWASVSTWSHRPKCEKCQTKCLKASGRRGSLSAKRTRAAWREFIPCFSYRCPRCLHHTEVPMTEIESERFDAVDRARRVQSEAIHRTYHDFLKHFRTKGADSLTGSSPESWKWIGYSLMKKVERFADHYPHVLIRHCDDAIHTSSDIVFIPHQVVIKNKVDWYWGTTVIVIPQSGVPCEFFLYGSHVTGGVRGTDRGLLSVFNHIAQMHRKHGDRN